MEHDLRKYASYIPGLRFWIIMACIIIVFAAIKQASFFINMLLLAVFITSISLAPLEWLKRKKIPETLAIIIVIIGILVLLSLISLIIGSSVNNFISKLPFYEEKFINLWGSTQVWMKEYNLVEDDFNLIQELNPGSLAGMAGGFLASMGNVVAEALLVFILFIFMIFEASSFGNKMRLVSPESSGQTDSILSRLKRYFGIKFLTSLATGLMITIALIIIGVDFPVLWGFLAFILNFIPSVGSFLAAIPAVLLALIQISPFGALITAIVYFAINTLIGNIVEPQLMGRNLGISPLIVFVSMIFFGYILGPIGMLIATPLTIVIKIILDNRPVTRNLGILLSDEASLKELQEELNQKMKDGSR
jgi:predicted PurR-regulated permease PerM